jgi:hypothetical protein
VSPFPAAPVGDLPACSGSINVRYEDVTQDGRVSLLALPQSLGVVWRDLAERPYAARFRETGVVPLLTRLCVEGGDGPVSVRNPLAVEGSFLLAHGRDSSGAVNRLVLVMWSTVTGIRARTHGPPPAGAGEPLQVGRVFAEHVFTRPFGPPEQRKVLRFEIEGLPEVPAPAYAWQPPATIATVPEGARSLDAEEVVDRAPIVFALDHTDSNQHVNSLVYPRLFAECAMRRLVAHDRSRPTMARQMEVGYRKPCFAGDRMRFRARAYLSAQEAGACGSLVPDADPAARPHCFVRMSFE